MLSAPPGVNVSYLNALGRRAYLSDRSCLAGAEGGHAVMISVAKIDYGSDEAG